jgi:hypothetical protein
MQEIIACPTMPLLPEILDSEEEPRDLKANIDAINTLPSNGVPRHAMHLTSEWTAARQLSNASASRQSGGKWGKTNAKVLQATLPCFLAAERCFQLSVDSARPGTAVITESTLPDRLFITLPAKAVLSHAVPPSKLST